MRLVNDAVALRLTRLHILIVELLRHGEHAGGVSAARLGGCGKQAGGAGHAARCGRWWRLHGRCGYGAARACDCLVALRCELRDGVRYLVEEVVNFVLVKALAVLRLRERLVQNVLCREKSHVQPRFAGDRLCSR